MLDTALTAANRAATLIRRLLAFARHQRLDPKVTDINAVVSDLEDLLRRTLGEAISIETSLSLDLWLTEIDTEELENAILNLAINARDAMPSGGRLTLTTANTRLEPSDAGSEIVPGDYITLAVADTGTGTGMSPDVAARVFEPFFTTKEPGRGEGAVLQTLRQPGVGARWSSPARGRWSATRRASSSCSPPTRARAGARTARASTARASRWRSARTPAGCPVRCSTGSTCRCTCHRCTGRRSATRPVSRAPRGGTGRGRPRGTTPPVGRLVGPPTGSCPDTCCDVPRSSRPEATAVLERSLEQGRLTLRGYDRVLRVAWSAADLAGLEVPGRDEVATGLALRSGELVAA